MNKKLLTIVTAVGLMMAMVAAPAAAETPLVGEMDLQFNVGFGDPSTPCSTFTWAGTIDFDDETYGIAFIPTGGTDGERGFLFEEYWIIYETFVPEFTDGVLTGCVGDMTMVGHDHGTSNIAQLTAVAEGQVIWVAESGPFDPDLAGSRVVFKGMSDASFLEFNGMLKITP